MRETSALYQSLRSAPGSWYEVQILQGETKYGPDRLKSCKVTSGLFTGDGPQIGCTSSAQCTVTLVEDKTNWPRMAQFTVRVRLVSGDGTQHSEWLSMGIFYTDERSADKYGNLTIVGYDGMLLLEQSWTDKVRHLPAYWPATAKTAAAILAEASGFEIDGRSELDDIVRFVGLDTLSTCREVFSTIAAAHGGNWLMTPEGKLLLVPLGGDADSAGSVPVMRFEDGIPLEAVSGVELQTEAGTVASAGYDGGYVLKGTCNFSDSDAANLCYRTVDGYQYVPFTAEGVLLDPASLPGDTVTLFGTDYPIITAEWTLGPMITATISAPVETEVDHEYTVRSEAARALQKALAATGSLDASLRSYISQTAESIQLGVSERYTSKEDAASQYQALLGQITVTANSITQSVSQDIQYLQDQIDGVVRRYSGSAVPTLENEPASGWSQSELPVHVGDLYVVNSGGGDNAGFYYRFEDNNGSYGWTLLKDSEVTKALADAAAANAAVQALALNLQQNYYTATQTAAELQQLYNAIRLSVSEQTELKAEVAEMSDGAIVLQIPYEYNNGRAYFHAVVYRSGVDITDACADWQFQWYTYSETDREPALYAEETKEISVKLEDMNYGGVVICRFSFLMPTPLTDHYGNVITDHNGTPVKVRAVGGQLEVQSALYQPGYINNKFSELNVTVDGITAQVSETLETTLDGYYTKSEIESKISASTTEITASVSSTYATQNALGELDSRVSTAEQKITDSAIVSTVTKSQDWTSLQTTVTQTADGLSSKVGNGSIISAINQSAENVTINASKVDLSGLVTIRAYNSDKANNVTTSNIQSVLGSANVTEINGGKIKTNSINANSIKVGDFTNLVTVSEQDSDSMLPATHRLGGTRTVTISNGDKYVTKAASTSFPGRIGLCEWKPNSFSASDELYYSITGYAGTDYTTVYLRVYGYVGAASESTIKSVNFTFRTYVQNFAGSIKLDSSDISSYSMIGFSLTFSSSYNVYVRNVEIRRKNTGNLIVDGTITSGKLKLTDMLTIYNGSKNLEYAYIGFATGKTIDDNGNEQDTYGAKLAAKGGSNYVLVTDSGARMTAGGKSLYVTANGVNSTGRFKAATYLEAAGSYVKANSYIEAGTYIKAGGSITGVGEMTLNASGTNSYVNITSATGKDLYLSRKGSSTTYRIQFMAGTFRPWTSKGLSCGSETYYWNGVYGSTIYSNGTALSTSDRKRKEKINYDVDRYVALLDDIRPCSFRYIDGDSGRTHLGMVAQDVTEVMKKAGIGLKDFAAVCIEHTYYDETGLEINDPEKREYAAQIEDIYYLRYGEFVPLLIAQNQKQQREIDALKAEIAEIKALLQGGNLNGNT